VKLSRICVWRKRLTNILGNRSPVFAAALCDLLGFESWVSA
jgi:hypothetical protein